MVKKAGKDDDSQSDGSNKIEKKKRGYAKSFKTNNFQSPQQKLHTLSQTFYSSDRGENTRHLGRHHSVFYLQLKTFNFASPLYTLLIEPLVFYQEVIFGAFAYQRGSTQFYVFVTSQKHSVPQANLFFRQMITNIFWMPEDIPSYTSISFEEPDKEIVTLINKWSSLPSEGLKEYRQDLFKNIGPILINRGYEMLFTWYPEVLPVGTEGQYSGGMKILSQESQKTQHQAEELVFVSQLQIKNYVVGHIFRNLMTSQGIKLFGSSGTWLHGQKGFASQSGNLMNNPQAYDAFALFYKCHESTRLAEMTFDSHGETQLREAYDRLHPWMQPLFELGDDTFQTLVQGVRQDIVTDWAILIDTRVNNFLNSMSPLTQSMFTTINSGVLKTLIAAAPVIDSYPEFVSLEIDFEQIEVYSIVGFLILSWAIPDPSKNHMSLIIQGSAGSGKSMVADMLEDNFGFVQLHTNPQSIFQSGKAHLSSGFTSPEINMLDIDLHIAQHMRTWADWSLQKQTQIKSKEPMMTKKFTPFVVTSNGDFLKWADSLFLHKKTSSFPPALHRRFSVARFDSPKVSRSYSNGQKITDQLSKSIFRACVFYAVLAYGAIFLKKLTVYEHQHLFERPVEQQPLKALFSRMLDKGRLSNDLFTRLICQGKNHVSDCFLHMIFCARKTSIATLETLTYLLEEQNRARLSLENALNSEVSKYFLNVQVVHLHPEWTNVQIKFTQDGFAYPQAYYEEWLAPIVTKDPMQLVRDFTSKTSKAFIFSLFTGNITQEQIEKISQWLAYLVKIQEFSVAPVQVVNLDYIPSVVSQTQLSIALAQLEDDGCEPCHYSQVPELISSHYDDTNQASQTLMSQRVSCSADMTKIVPSKVISQMEEVKEERVRHVLGEDEPIPVTSHVRMNTREVHYSVEEPSIYAETKKPQIFAHEASIAFAQHHLASDRYCNQIQNESQSQGSFGVSRQQFDDDQSLMLPRMTQPCYRFNVLKHVSMNDQWVDSHVNDRLSETYSDQN